MPLPGLVDTAAGLDEVLATLEPLDVVTIDTEFSWERSYYPTLALVQVAGRVADGTVRGFACDPLEVDLAPLIAFLAEPDRLKVLHAARIDLQIVARLHGEPIGPVFDTQAAAALCGYGPQVGYANLVQAVLDVRVPKTEQWSEWTKRPLRPEQVEYAMADVVHLVAVYEHLREQLERDGRLGWAEQEMRSLMDPATYVEPPDEELYLKVKRKNRLDRRGLGILRELAVWRDQAARRRNLRPGFVIKDPGMIELVNRRPRSQGALKQVRGVHKNEARRSGKEILSAIQRGLDLPEAQLPQLPRKSKGRRRDVGAAVELMRAYLAQRAEEGRVATETIVTTAELERLARDAQRERFKHDHPVLQGWRGELVGRDLVRLLRGELSLGLDPKSSELRLVEGGE